MFGMALSSVVDTDAHSKTNGCQPNDAPFSDARFAKLSLQFDLFRASTIEPGEARMKDDVKESLEDTIGYEPPIHKRVLLDTAEFQADSRSRYTLTRVQGQGGLGQVWLALDGTLGREVALKEIRPDRHSDERTVKRLLKEAQITGQLEHPNIVPVYELARTENDKPFYTMRFLRGQPLDHRIKVYHAKRNHGPHDALELRQLLTIFASVCQAIAYAHARGVVHRDLKPHNVMLGDFGEVMVIDWGLAKLVSDRAQDDNQRIVEVSADTDLAATREGNLMGSPAYMAPEQANGQVSLLDERTDIYGLGAILFAILAGLAPHRSSQTGNTARDTRSLIRQITEGPTPHARNVDTYTPKPLAAICAKAMAKERAERYGSAAELAADVERWLADEPVSVYTDAWSDRAARWLRRHRTWAQAAALSLVTVTLVATAATVLISQAKGRLAAALTSEAIAHRETERALVAESQALQAERDALLAERLAKAEATRRFKEARDTIDKSLMEVSEALQYFPGVEPARRELLERAAGDYERFAAEKSDDPELKLEAGRARLGLGDVRRLLLQHDEAEAAYRAAEQLFRELSDTVPQNGEYRFQLANAHARLGVLFTATGEHDDAQRYFLLAREALDSLIANDEDNARFRSEQAKFLINHALLHNKVNDFDSARRLLEQAEQSLSGVPGAADDIDVLALLAKARGELGQQLVMLGRTQDAVDRLQSAVNTYGLLVTDHPPYLEGLTSARISLANAYRTLGHDADVVESYERSIVDFGDLLTSRPGVPHYRESRALARTDLAGFLSVIGRNHDAKEQAAEALREFIDLVDTYPMMYRYHVEHAVCTQTFGIILRDLDDNENAETACRDAVRRFDELTRAVPDVPEYRRRLASARSSLGRLFQKVGRHEEARQSYLAAIADFQKAMEAGLDDPLTHDPLAWCHTHFGDLLLEMGPAEEARVQYVAAIGLREAMQNNPNHLDAFARLLAQCGDVELRNRERAIALSRQACELVPANPRFANGLGLALYRAGKWHESIEALRAAESLRSHPDSSDSFLLALAYGKTGDQEQANQYYENAVQIMQADQPGNIELLKLLAEAALALEPEAS